MHNLQQDHEPQIQRKKDFCVLTAVSAGLLRSMRNNFLNRKHTLHALETRRNFRNECGAVSRTSCIPLHSLVTSLSFCRCHGQQRLFALDGLRITHGNVYGEHGAQRTRRHSHDVVFTAYISHHGVGALARRVVGVLPQEGNQGAATETLNNLGARTTFSDGI